MAASFPLVGPPWDKGLALSLSGTSILAAAYTYTPVVNPSATVNGTLTPTGACVQFSGASRQVAICVNLVTAPASPITTITLSVEGAYGNFTDGNGVAQTVDLTVQGHWFQILSQAHTGAGALAVDSALVFGAAPLAAPGKTMLLTSAFLGQAKAKHLKIGAKANAIGIAGDVLQLFVAAW